MTTPVTPIRQPPLALLQNAINVCVAYEDAQNVAAVSAQQQLGRVRALILQALAGLGEPHHETIAEMQRLLLYHYGMGYDEAKGDSYQQPSDIITEREARDAAAVITHVALNWTTGPAL